MAPYVWYLRIMAINIAGWGALFWLVTGTSPHDPRARLAFVCALAAGLYATFSLLAYALSLVLWPAASGRHGRAFGDRQGLLWAGLLITVVLLRLSGELSAATLFITLAAFVGVQCARPGWPA